MSRRATTDTIADVPIYERPEVHSRRWFLLGVMSASLVLVVMSVSALNVAAPSLQGDLRATATEVQWILDSYVLVFAGSLLAAGSLGDRFGRREALVGGLLVFAAGSLVSALAGSPDVVIIGRAVQGLGAAFVMPATLSIITMVFPPQEIGRAIAIWVGFAGAGGAIGQLVAGGLLESFWWGSTILINVPVALAAVAIVAVYVPRLRGDGASPLDPIGSLLSMLAAVALLFGIIEGPVRGWSDGLVLAAFVVAIVAFGTFLWWEARTPHPVLPLSLFRDGRFSIGSASVTLTFFAMIGFWFLLSQYLQFGRGYSPLLAGATIVPMAVVATLVSPRSASLAERFGPAPVMVAGFAVLAAGFLPLATVGTSSPAVVIVASSVVLAVGMSLTMAPATAWIMAAVPPAKAGVGSAVNDTTREFGSALGIAILGSIANAAYRSRIDLDGLGLDPEVRAVAEESVGAATSVAPGTSIQAQAAEAFADAFNVVGLVSAAIMLAAAAAVWAAARRITQPRRA